MNLSTFFTLEEFTASQYAVRRGIKNIPSPNAMGNLKVTADGLELVRRALKTPVHITSGYRSPTLNLAIGGASNSDHALGFAADFVSPQFGTPYDIVKKIVSSGIKFDQIIFEGQWVHISFNPRMRQQALTATFDNRGKASYKAFI